MPEYDDAYDYDDDDAAPVPQKEDPMGKLRQQNRALNKDLKARDKELEELRSFRAAVEAERREAVVAKVAQELNLQPEHAKLYARLNPDTPEPTREDVLAFAMEYGLVAKSAEAEAAKAVTTETFRPIQVGGTSPVQNKLTREQWLELQETDMDAAIRAFQEGRVTGTERLNERD